MRSYTHTPQNVEAHNEHLLLVALNTKDIISYFLEVLHRFQDDRDATTNFMKKSGEKNALFFHFFFVNCTKIKVSGQTTNGETGSVQNKHL